VKVLSRFCCADSALVPFLFPQITKSFNFWIFEAQYSLTLLSLLEVAKKQNKRRAKEKKKNNENNHNHNHDHNHNHNHNNNNNDSDNDNQ